MNFKHPVAAIILAAGKGTRMKSSLHKVLHPIAGRPMLGHLMAALDQLGTDRRVVIVGDKAAQVEKYLSGSAQLATQEPQLGTAHAVLQGEEALAGFSGTVLILFADVPLVRPETMERLVRTVDEGAAIAVLGFRPAQPGAYGRIIAGADGRIEKMVEAKDATPDELAVTLCNSGLMAVRADLLVPLLKAVGNDNAAGEYYLPDIVMLAREQGEHPVVLEGDMNEVVGVNSRSELAAAEALFQQRRRAELMAEGVTLIAPETVFLSHDTRIEADAVIEPNVVFGPNVSISSGTVIHSFSHIEGATIGPDCDIGPYARLRPGTVLHKGAKIGNFVETKKTVLGEGAKANHLTYLGDATVGARANIGAGTITCNYDGFNKSQTHIGEGAFIGSNSALVAPVSIGDGAIVGAGSTITRNVSADALALVRTEQQEKSGWAARFRALMQSKKKA